MPTIDFGFERAERQGLERAERQGREQGIEQGREQGIEQGIEKNRCEAVTRMLTRGMPEDQILDVLQLTAEQLDKIKRDLKQS